MKKLFSILFILGLLPMLFACKSEQDAPEQQEAVDYVEFLSKNQANWMSVEEAEDVLKDEKVDKASKEYREAAYTVTKDSVSTMIETPSTIFTISKIWLRLREKSSKKSATISTSSSSYTRIFALRPSLRKIPLRCRICLTDGISSV